jgi:predicted permease
METLLRDVRLALRLLLRRPLVSALAVLSLALGIGANTAVFSIVNALFFKSLPVSDPGTLVALYTVDERNPGLNPLSHLNWKDLREQRDVFAEVTAYDWVPLSLSTGGEAELGFGQLVAGNYFPTLGVKAARGRLLAPEDDLTLGAHPVVVLSHAFWTRRLGGREDAVGRTLLLNAVSFTVIGVTPPAFTGVTVGIQPDVWAPMAMNRELHRDANWYEQRRGLFLFGLARLAPGATPAGAQAAAATLGKRLAREYPADNEGRTFRVVPFAQSTLPTELREPARAAAGMLSVIVGLVLLIACANVANLLLARAATRRKEIALRLALGAGRAALVRQLLTESMLLALAGALGGLLVALWARGAILGFLPSLPLPITVKLALDLDARVLGTTLVIALVTGLLAGLAPAWQLARPQLVEALKERGGADARIAGRVSLRSLLVGAQVALAFVALAGAGLFVRSLAAAQRSDPGFDTEHLGLVSFDLTLQGYDEARGRLFAEQALERVGALPGVERVTLAQTGPLGVGFLRSVFPEGQEGGRGVLVQVNAVGPGYFETLGVPLVRGRAFGPADRRGAPPVVVINATMAAQFWPGRNPLGQRFRFFGEDTAVEVVGVARDAKYNTLGEAPQPYLYLPLDQAFTGALTLVARAHGDPERILLPLQRELRALQRELPFVGLSSVGQLISNSLWASRLGASLLLVFGVLALVLASVGIYGVMSYTVSQRAPEIGIRMALGADRGSVLRLVLRQGMQVVGAGLLLGVAVALALTRLVGALLFVGPGDPLVFGAMGATLVAVGALANVFPARRAATLDPLRALRCE